jgi:hypothetical protein
MDAAQLAAELTAQYGHLLSASVISAAVCAAFRTTRVAARASSVARQDVAALAAAVLRSPVRRAG